MHSHTTRTSTHHTHFRLQSDMGFSTLKSVFNNVRPYLSRQSAFTSLWLCTNIIMLEVDGRVCKK